LDVGRRAGVSHGTVSRVLNNQPIRVSDKTRQRVLRVAQELGYVPNRAAQFLKTGRTGSITVIAYDITDAFVVECIRHMEAVLAQTNYRARWISCSRAPGQSSSEFMASLHAMPMDGLVVVESGRIISDSDILRFHAQSELQVLTLYRQIKGGHISSLVLNNELGTRLIMQHLLSFGHSRIGFCRDKHNHEGAMIRENTYRTMMSESGLAIRRDWVSDSAGSFEGGYEAATRILQSAHRPTAIFCFNDLSAFGAIRACIQCGLRVPEDVSVAGFDNVQMAACYNPSLTTIETNYEEVGRLAIQTLISQIEQEAPLFEATQIVVDPKLVVRESTAPVPR
jgi:DNA-binding LacI/PurR family transcriptional regulator